MDTITTFLFVKVIDFLMFLFDYKVVIFSKQKS